MSKIANEVLFSAGAAAASNTAGAAAAAGPAAAAATVATAKLPNPLIKLAAEDFSKETLEATLTKPGADLNEVINPDTKDTVARALFDQYRAMIKAGKEEADSDMKFLVSLFKKGAVPNDKWRKEGGMFLSYAWRRAQDLDTVYGKYGKPSPKVN